MAHSKAPGHIENRTTNNVRRKERKTVTTMTNHKTGTLDTMKTPPIVSPQEWEAARQQLLAKEKELTYARDALAAQRRRMPWMAIEKQYSFEGPQGKATLLDLFEGRRQLIIYRAFFEPGVFGWTPDPCGYGPALPGTSSKYNGQTGLSGAGNTYQLAEGRVGPAGRAVYATLNNNQSVPWIWSVVEFNASGAPVNITSPANYQIFPTYYIYVNGILQTADTIQQVSVPTITEPIYQNSQLVPPPSQ